MKADYHIHSNTSNDSQMTVAEICESAIAAGMDEICITNHQEFKCFDDGNEKYIMKDEDVANFRKDVEQARKDFPQLVIKFGLEIGYLEKYENEIREYIDKHDFDFVLMSLHDYDGVCFADCNFEHDFSRDKVIGYYKFYFDILKKAVRMNCFDSLAHIDVVRRALPEAKFQEYREYFEDFVKEMKKYDAGFEVNTSGWINGLGVQHPHDEILKILYENGITKVTIGSDSHKPENVGRNIEKAQNLLKEIGFKQFCTYEKRRPIFHDL